MAKITSTGDTCSPSKEMREIFSKELDLKGKACHVDVHMVLRLNGVFLQPPLCTIELFAHPNYDFTNNFDFDLPLPLYYTVNITVSPYQSKSRS